MLIHGCTIANIGAPSGGECSLMVEVQVFCPNCYAWVRIGRAEVDEETLRALLSLLGRVKFRGVPEGAEPLFPSLAEAFRLRPT